MPDVGTAADSLRFVAQMKAGRTRRGSMPDTMAEYAQAALLHPIEEGKAASKGYASPTRRNSVHEVPPADLPLPHEYSNYVGYIMGRRNSIGGASTLTAASTASGREATVEGSPPLRPMPSPPVSPKSPGELKSPRSSPKSPHTSPKSPRPGSKAPEAMLDSPLSPRAPRSTALAAPPRPTSGRHSAGKLPQLPTSPRQATELFSSAPRQQPESERDAALHLLRQVAPQAAAPLSRKAGPVWSSPLNS